MASLTPEEIAEVDRRTAEVKSKKSFEEQLGELRGVERKLGSGAQKTARRIAEATRLRKIREAKARAKAAKKAALDKAAEATKQRAIQIRKAKFAASTLSRKEELSLKAREQLKRAAQARGAAFNRLETQRFIQSRGGSISALRSARRKGVTFEQLEGEEKQKQFKEDLKSGKILGFSGAGLGAEQMNRREALIKLGLIKKVSSATDVLTTAPLIYEYFIDSKPTPSENKTWNEIIKNKINEFQTIAKNGEKSKLGKFNIFRNMSNVVINMDNKISKIRKTKSRSQLINLSNGIKRDKSTLIRGLFSLGILTPNATKRQVQLALLGFSSSILKFGSSIPGIAVGAVGLAKASPGIAAKTPAALKKFAKNPKNYIKKGYSVSKRVGKMLVGEATAFGKLAMVEPGLAIGKIGAEFFVLKGIGKGFSVTGKVSAKATRKFNPYFKKLEDGKIIIRKVPEERFVVRGKTRLLKKRVQKPSFKRPFSSVSNFLKGRKPGQFKKFTKDPGLLLKSQTVESGAKTLSGQVAIAGQEVTAVNASAHQLSTWLKRKKIIRKPIPGQKKWNDYSGFPKKIGDTIRKFDNGIKVSFKDFVETNKWLMKNRMPNTTLLERSMYFDPASGLRLSRLGITKETRATFKDLFTGNFTLFKNKPTIYIMENIKVEAFPRYLRDVRLKLLKSKTLTDNELQRLLKWQVKKSGKLKPIGSTIYQGGKELEVTLAPNEIIKKVKKLGFTEVQGAKVKIWGTEIYKPSKTILNKIKLAQLGKLTKIEVKKLERFLSRITKSKIRIETPSSRKIKEGKIKVAPKKKKKVAKRKKTRLLKKRVQKPLLRPPRGSAALIARRIKRKVKVRPRVRDKKGVRTKVRPKAKTKKAVRPKKGVRTKVRPKAKTKKAVRPKVRPSMRRRTSKPSTRPPLIIKIPKGYTSRKLPKKVPAYYVKEKVKGRIKNLTPRPLTLREAKDFLAYRLDNRLSKSGYFEPLGNTNKVVNVPAKMKGYFGKNSRKFRPYKIRLGKKKQIRNGYIEKRKYSFDKPGERVSARKVRKKTTIKRKVTPAQRKMIIKRLKMARAAKQKNKRR